MTRSKFHFLFFCILSILFFSSCKVKKISAIALASPSRDTAMVIDNEAARVIQRSLDNKLDYNWFSTRIKVEYSDNNISQDFTAAVRMRRDSIMWISLQGPFGIEGGRILLTLDSIYVVNKISSEYLHQPISYLSTIMPVQTELPQLQDFILGCYLLFSGAAPDSRGLTDSLYQIQAESPQFRYQSAFYPQNYTLAKSVLTDKMLSQQMNVTFAGYSTEQGKPFSTERNIDIKQGSKVFNLHLIFTKIKVNEVQNFPFEISPGMRQVDRIRF